LHYTYDILNRLSQLTSTDGTLHYTYTYDLNDNVTVVTDHIHHKVQRRFFDPLNRLVKEELNADMALHYQYDGLSRVIQLTLPDGSTIRYGYDAFHLKQVQRFNALGTLLYTCDCQDYTLDHKLLAAASPAGVVRYTYDLLGRVTSIQAPEWHVNLETFDAVGNLLTRQQKDLAQETFAYDRFNHLTAESASANTYAYDSIGNCLVKNNQARLINERNQVINDGTCHYTYDANGNLLNESDPPRSYRYDAYNRLIHCQTETDQFTFVYDAFGRCLEIINNQGTRYLIYQGEKEIGSAFNGQVDELRVMHPAKPKETVFSIELQNQVYFPIQDERYNMAALQREGGALAQWTRYSAFAQEAQGGDTDITNPWGFANRRKVVNLVLFLHRFYNPKLMRWQTTDPLGFADGLNMYAYVHNNPFLYTDPDGRFSWAFAFPVLDFTFGLAGFVCPPLALTILTGVAICSTAYVVNSYVQDCRMKNAMLANNHEPQAENVEDDKSKEKSKEWKAPRTEPKNLGEQLALEEAKHADDKRILEGKINDPRYPEDVWAKREHIHKPLDTKEDHIDIHYWEHLPTGERHGFKFKN
jgi:RHS repeat-associated protein